MAQVELADYVEILNRIGCDIGQGYLHALSARQQWRDELLAAR